MHFTGNDGYHIDTKNCSFGTVKLVKTAINSKFIYNAQRTAFDRVSWSFSNNFAINVVIFGADNSSSTHL